MNEGAMVASSFWLFRFETKLPPVGLKHLYESLFLLHTSRILHNTASPIAGTSLNRRAIIIKELFLAHLLISFINHNSRWSLPIMWR